MGSPDPRGRPSVLLLSGRSQQDSGHIEFLVRLQSPNFQVSINLKVLIENSSGLARKPSISPCLIRSKIWVCLLGPIRITGRPASVRPHINPPPIFTTNAFMYPSDRGGSSEQISIGLAKTDSLIPRFSLTDLQLFHATC